MKYAAFLRGINVGGNNIIPMKELALLSTGAGFKNVRTYINSGNVLFESNLSEAKIRDKLEAALRKKMGKDIPVVIRNEKELKSILSANPYPNALPAKIGVVLFTHPVPESFITGIVSPGPEEILPSGRELFIYFPDGMGRSKLKFPSKGEVGTVRNINTIGKLAEMISK